MRNFERNFITEWRRLGLPTEGVSIVVAVSGGADSLALAGAVAALRDEKKLELRIVLAHFNHRLRGAESDGDERLVRAFAEGRGLEFALGQASPLPKGNLEQAAREARYAFLSEVASNVKAPVVLTGHTVDDQAETVLLNLIRGSGPKGLGAMSPVREIGNGAEFEVFHEGSPNHLDGKVYLVRPLLGWASRAETEGYCHEAEIAYCSDSMNEDLAFARVRVRKLLLPLLRELNPRITETLSRTAELLRLELPGHGDDLLGIVWEDETLAVKELKEIPRDALMRGLRAWLGARRGSLRGIEHVHVSAVADLVLSVKSGRTVELPGKAKAVKSKGVLTYKK